MPTPSVNEYALSSRRLLFEVILRERIIGYPANNHARCPAGSTGYRDGYISRVYG
jgi:hypothetical protein